MILFGTMAGLLSAGCTAVSYVCSRRFMTRSTLGSRQLTAMSFSLMGLASAAMLPFFLDQPWPPLRTLVLPLLMACGFFLIAQITSFVVLKYIQASRISPLLGMKIIAIAVLTPLFLGTLITPTQWVAVGMSVVAALLLIQIGGRLPWQATAGVAVMVICYSLSDIGIVQLVAALDCMGHGAVMLALVLIYLLAGIVGFLALLVWGIPARSEWKLALPYTTAWFCSAIFYFISLRHLGVVLAIIVQATRGLQSIALGAILAHRGHHDLEEHVDKLTLVKRIAAAILMAAAIAVYVCSAQS